MRWSNEMFYILLLNSFAGAIAYGFWIIAKNGMAKKKKLIREQSASGQRKKQLTIF